MPYCRPAFLAFNQSINQSINNKAINLVFIGNWSAQHKQHLSNERKSPVWAMPENSHRIKNKFTPN